MIKKLLPDGVDSFALVFCFAGLLTPAFLLHKANRLADGVAVPFTGTVGLSAYLILALLLFTALSGGLLKDRKGILRVAGISGCLMLTTAISGTYADAVSAESVFARVSFSTGYWLFFLGCTLFYLQAYATSVSKLRFIFSALFFTPLVFLILSGFLDKMSVLQEYLNYRERFLKEMSTHIYISFGSVLLAGFAGVPLGVLASKHRGLSEKLFDGLNIVQTVPSIALFGLLMVPLAWLSDRLEVLQYAGVSGVGWAPAVIALFLYSLLPVVRNTYEGVRSVSDGVKEAAKGMGMTRGDILFRVEVPLSLPVVLNGFRVALVQSVGNTAVVSLIGAGGMGIFIFQGLGQSAGSLIMLGTIPTVILAVLVDSFMHGIISLLKGKHYD